MREYTKLDLKPQTHPKSFGPTALIPNGSSAIMAQRREPPDALDHFPTPPWPTRALERPPSIWTDYIAGRSGFVLVAPSGDDRPYSRKGEPMPSVNKTVHYRRFEPTSDPWTRGTLQSVLTAAFAATTATGTTFGASWNARTFPVPGEQQLKRFAHNLAISTGGISGTLCLYSPDDWAAVLRHELAAEQHVSLDQTLQQVEIAERPPLEGEDYLRGIAYWLVIADHLFVVQHTSIQTKAFEEYFDALLRGTTAILENDRFALRAVFNKAVLGGDLEDITAVEVGGILNRSVPGVISLQIADATIEEQRTLGRTTSRFEKAYDVLRAVFGAPDAERIRGEIPSEAELEVDVRFGYKTRRRGVSRAALNEIARAARNLPDGEVIAFGRDGKQIGDDLRLSMGMPFSLVRERGALLDLEDVRTKLLRVYQRFVEDGKIDQ